MLAIPNGYALANICGGTKTMQANFPRHKANDPPAHKWDVARSALGGLPKKERTIELTCVTGFFRLT